MLAAFQEQQGLDLKFIVEVIWDEGEDPIMYSTCEYDGLEVYPYVKEFGTFQSVSHVEGLGAVSSMEVVFYDQFGHFKEKLNNVDLVERATATVYLTLDGSELFDLFEGKISDSASWANNEFKIEVLSENIDKEVGYQPSIDDVDETEPDYEFLERHLNTSSAWPAVFGTVKNYEIPIIWTQREAVTEEDISYEPGSDPPYYELKIDQHDDFTLDTEYFVNIVGKINSVFSILGYGVFTDNEDGDPVFRLTKEGVHSNWYKNIAFTILDNNGIVGDTDQPTTRITIEPGPVTIDEVELHTLGPDGEETTSVWLQFMKLEIRYSFMALSGPGASSKITLSKYVNCSRQQGNVITLNENLSLVGGAFDIYIRTVSKANDIIYQIPSGSKIYIMGDRIGYAVDTKTDTVIDRIAIKHGDELVTIDPAAYEVSTAALWIGTHPPVKYIHMLGEVYMRYIEHYALEGNSNEGLLASAHNTYNSEAEAIAQLTDIPTIDLVPNETNFVYLSVEDAQDVVPEIAWQANKAVRYTRENNDDVLELIDLTDTTTPAVYSFTEDNILFGSVEYGFTSKDNLYTVFKASFQTNNLLKDLETIRMKKNNDIYGEEVLETDYYIFKSKTVAKQKLSWWKDKLSRFYYTIKLTGFMDAFGLEVWDRVHVSLDPSTFYDPADGTPYTHTHDADPQPIIGYGRIKEIAPDLTTGLVEFTIEVE
jgi:hypothetical protein